MLSHANPDIADLDEDITFQEDWDPEGDRRDEYRDYVSSFPMLIEVAALASIANPLTSPPWAGTGSERWDPAIIREMVQEGQYGPAASYPADPFSSDPVRHHMERIAWLALHPAEDEITVDASAPSFSWPIADGNHRLAAALLRGDRRILTCVVGEPGDIEMFCRQVGLEAWCRDHAAVDTAVWSLAKEPRPPRPDRRDYCYEMEF